MGLLKLQCISLSENTSKPLNLLNYFFRLSDAPWERRGSEAAAFSGLSQEGPLFPF